MRVCVREQWSSSSPAVPTFFLYCKGERKKKLNEFLAAAGAFFFFFFFLQWLLILGYLPTEKLHLFFFFFLVALLAWACLARRVATRASLKQTEFRDVTERSKEKKIREERVIFV